MTESSKDKTKRKYLSYLTNYVWVQQTSLFANLMLEDYEYDCELAKNVVIEYFNEFKDKLRKLYGDTAFLVIVRALAKSNEKIKNTYSDKIIHQIYVTIYSSNLINEGYMKELVDSVYGDSSINVATKKIAEKDLNKACNTIKNQKLHNLEILLGDRKPNRYSVINQRKLVKQKKSIKIEYLDDNVPF